MEKKLKAYRALITGASRGIGRATAILFANHGAEVFLTARSKDELDNLKQDLEKQGHKAHVVPADLGSDSDIKGIFEYIDSHGAALDSVVNCAGVFDRSEVEKIDPDDYDLVQRINSRAPLLICKYAIPLLAKSDHATIVNISSLSGCFGLRKFPGLAAYNISKYALWGLTEILAVELEDKGIRVNQVSPGGVDTKMFEQAWPSVDTPALKAEDIARAVLYLASSDSDPVTGENIKIPGK